MVAVASDEMIAHYDRCDVSRVALMEYRSLEAYTDLLVVGYVLQRIARSKVRKELLV